MRTSLSHVGGPSSLRGDPEAAKTLARCLAVSPGDPLPLTHAFHAFPARMHPETARRALDAFRPGPTGVILDPFVGSGTTALEAVRSGMTLIGVDVSLVALEIAWVKTRVMLPPQCRRVEVEGTRLARQAVRDINLDFVLPQWAQKERAWYSPHTLREIALLKELIDRYEDADLRRMLLAVLSSIVVKLSRQPSDSVTAPDPNFKPWASLSTFRLFEEKCAELTKLLLLLSSDLYKRQIPAINPVFRLDDARTVVLQPGIVDLVLTSPPYPATYDYALQQARRYPIYGDDGSYSLAHEMGARRDLRDWPAGLRRYRLDLEACFKNLLSALKPGGKMLLLIGDGRIQERPVFSDRIVEDLASTLGFRFAAGASQERPDYPGGRKKEHLLLLEKPSPARAPSVREAKPSPEHGAPPPEGRPSSTQGAAVQEDKLNVRTTFSSEHPSTRGAPGEARAS